MVNLSNIQKTHRKKRIKRNLRNKRNTVANSVTKDISPIVSKNVSKFLKISPCKINHVDSESSLMRQESEQFSSKKLIPSPNFSRILTNLPPVIYYQKDRKGRYQAVNALLGIRDRRVSNYKRQNVRFPVQLTRKINPESLKSLRTENVQPEEPKPKSDRLQELKEELKMLNKILNISRKKRRSEIQTDDALTDSVKKINQSLEDELVKNIQKVDFSEIMDYDSDTIKKDCKNAINVHKKTISKCNKACLL
ncbi:unnamed protein product [Moneuplotes crassus]|uniref:Uncharacterized protein n=1 Tax=Euplotes crassus TaxID=5936 RepID=A0AAD1Y916_EUPCR|nr:unnamed protein product [Moneuplotes crassus]